MLPLIPLAISIVPEIGKWLFGPSNAAAKTVADVAGVIKTVTGADPTTDAGMAAVSSILAGKPELATQLQVQIAQIAAQREHDERDADNTAFAEQIADIKDARAQTVSLAGSNSAIKWAAPIVSIVILGGFGTVIALAMTRVLPTGSDRVVDTMLGTLVTMAAAVVNYWLGSSAGSEHKTDLLYHSTPTSNQGPTP